MTVFCIKSQYRCHIVVVVNIYVRRRPYICLGVFALTEGISCLVRKFVIRCWAASGAAMYCNSFNSPVALVFVFVFAILPPQCGSHKFDEQSNQCLPTSTAVGDRGSDGHGDGDGGGGGGGGASGVAPGALVLRSTEHGLVVREVALSPFRCRRRPGPLCGPRRRFPPRPVCRSPMHTFLRFPALLDILISQPPIPGLQ